MTHSVSTPQVRVGILAVGTELTTGQVLNRNASWLSQKITEQGHGVTSHWTVPDSRLDIKNSLELLSHQNDLILITGGLGPTSDDFTREVIADWLELPLQWDESSWIFIQKRLSERGIAVQEIQKQQCYYPAGTVILENSLGTAHGFRIKHPHKPLWLICLPGPPRELQAIWNNHVQPWLNAEFATQNPWVIRSWDILGQPESEVARRVESRLQNCPYEKGYRVHLPYVEFKLCYFKNQEDSHWLNEADLCFADLVVRKDQRDIAEEFTQTLLSLSQKPNGPSAISVLDGASLGYLPHRLNDFQELLRVIPVSYSAQPIGKASPTEQSSEENQLRLRIELTQNALPNQEAKCSLNWGKHSFETRLPAIYSSSLLHERERHYFIERSFMFWNECLSNFTSTSKG